MRISDWSSDVCSSDLREREAGIRPRHQARLRPDRAHFRHVDEQFQQAEDKILYARALLLVAVVVIESGKIELEMLVEKRQLRPGLIGVHPLLTRRDRKSTRLNSQH